MRTDLALAALASAAVPGMKPVAVAAIGPSDDARGSELQSALVEDATGRRWVVRAPLTPVAGARLQRNDELVRQLPRHVPFKVPAAVGYAPLGKDGSAAVYPYVEGKPLDLRRLPGGPGLASAVGRALAAVHNIPRSLFEEQDVPVFDASGVRQRAIAEVDRAAETGRVPTGLLARWEEAFEAAPLWQFATTPVHGAFTGASLVVAFTDEEDAATGRVVAVTDWDEAMVGDPAADLAELWSQSSRQAWEAVLDSYALARTHRPDPYLQARARLVAEMRSLRGLARAVAEDDEEAARRAVEVLRRVDRLTEADDSLVPATARPSAMRPDPADGAVLPVSGAGSHEPAGGADEEVMTESDPAGRDGLPDTGALAGDGSAGEGGTGEQRPEQEAAPDGGPGDAGPGGASVARAGAEADVTMEVPVPPASGAHVEAYPDAPGAGDPLVHDPVERAADGATRDDPDRAPQGAPAAGGAGDADEASAAEPEDLQDDERLHELYGMPPPEREPGDR